MSFTRCCRLAPLFLASLSLNLPGQTPPQPAEAPPASHATYPQIVRLSLVEGDVRIARGKQDEKLTGNAWEQSAANIPLESGFSLATGPDGRAEIEFEDDSTLYLAPNSALTLADLTTKDGVPQTTLSLLSGTVTTHLYPTIPGERYLLQTPTHSLDVHFGETSYLRITGFLDAMQFTPLGDQQITANHVDLHAVPGHAYSIVGGRILPTTTSSTPSQLAWDNWVTDRVNARNAATQSVMHEANLSSPIPGLADLAGQGTFTPCAPYGTCWVPTNGWTQQNPDTTPAATPSPQQSSDTSTPIKPLPEAQQRYTVSVAQLRQSGSQTPSGPGVAPAVLSYDDFDDFPCDPWRLWYRRTLFAYPNNLYPYDWAVCHAGFWINRNHRYMWVAGTHKHHLCPVHWVKYQGKLGYVPMHPRDQRGLPPVNLRHGLYQLTDKPTHPVERVALDNKSSPKLLDSTPKEFRSPAPTQLARADAPQVAVHTMHESPRTGTNGAPSPRAVSSLTFDQHSNRFMLATRVTDGGHTHTFTEPMSDRGGHITPATGNGFRSSNAGGGGYNHAGGYSGGGGHSSGGGGSAGGGHSGGGGFSGGGGGGGGHSGGGGSSGGGGASSGGGASAGGGGGGGGHH